MTAVAVHTEMRLRTRVSEAAIKETLAGKVLGPADFDVLLTGPTRLLTPDGRPLCVYLPGAVAEHSADPDVYRVLHSLKAHTTRNRGMASGTKRFPGGTTDRRPGQRTMAREIASTVVGAMDPMGQTRYCRLTAWTGRNLPEWETVHPLLRTVAANLAEHVPDRYRNQVQEAERTHPAWVVPGTPFTTITVNNTYPTGVHTDRGDLEAGFSTIACLRRGAYAGGNLIFPAYRVAVDMRDGDLLLMDAHEWHGNVPIVCACGKRLNGPCEDCEAERISVVSYFRTKMVGCGSPEEELERGAASAEAQAERRNARAEG